MYHKPFCGSEHYYLSNKDQAPYLSFLLHKKYFFHNWYSFFVRFTNIIAFYLKSGPSLCIRIPYSWIWPYKCRKPVTTFKIHHWMFSSVIVLQCFIIFLQSRICLKKAGWVLRNSSYYSNAFENHWRQTPFSVPWISTGLTAEIQRADDIWK